MNKNQSITLVLGFVLTVLTWVWGNSQFQGYIGYEGSGRKYPQHREAVVEQRIKTKILVPTIIAEVAVTGILIFLLKDSKSKNEKEKGDANYSLDLIYLWSLVSFRQECHPRFFN